MKRVLQIIRNLASASRWLTAAPAFPTLSLGLDSLQLQFVAAILFAEKFTRFFSSYSIYFYVNFPGQVEHSFGYTVYTFLNLQYQIDFFFTS